MDKLKFKVTLLYKEDNTSRLEMFINGVNILEWKAEGEIRTTQWDLDDIIEYLVVDTIEFANTEDDFPYKDIKADNLIDLEDRCYSKEFDDEDEEMDFVGEVHDYFYNHSLGHANGGAVIASLMFRHIDNYMEIAWDNTNRSDYNINHFTYERGFVFIDINEYKEAIWDLKKQYEKIMK